MLTHTTPYLLVQHPLDAEPPRFDFWTWRLKRRFITDQLRALALSSTEHRSLLADIANRFELETVSHDHIHLLEEILGCELETQDDLTDALSQRVPRRRISLHNRWNVPVIRPEWNGMSMRVPVFQGKVNGVPLKARLETSREMVPPYRIIWIDENRSRESETKLSEPYGRNLSYGKPLWDWLFARRLTLLCMASPEKWPDPDAPPLFLDRDWPQPPRPF